MIKWQKIIKYGAIAFAFFLIFSILSSIIIGLNSVFSLFGSSNASKNMKIIDINESISVLDINIDNVELKIRNGNNFRIKVSDEEHISYSDLENRLIICEEGINLFDSNPEVIIYIPEDKVFESVFLTTGVGSVNIEEVKAKKMKLELGMGSVIIDNLEISNNTDIDTGVGEFIIKDGSINNLDLDIGVGDVVISSAILGKSEIDSGIGALELNLVGSVDDYKIGIDKGIGNFKIDDFGFYDGRFYGNGSNFIEVDGGIGEVDIKIIN